MKKIFTIIDDGGSDGGSHSDHTDHETDSADLGHDEIDGGGESEAEKAEKAAQAERDRIEHECADSAEGCMANGKTAGECMDSYGHSIAETCEAFGIDKVHEAGKSYSEIHEAGVSCSDIHATGATCAMMEIDGISVDKMYKEGISVETMYNEHVSIESIHAAGIPADACYEANITAEVMRGVAVSTGVGVLTGGSKSISTKNINSPSDNSTKSISTHLCKNPDDLKGQVYKNSGGKAQCVELVKQNCGTGPSSNWKFDDKPVSHYKNGEIPNGTPMATKDASGKYDNGHAVISNGYDEKGQIRVIEQWHHKDEEPQPVKDNVLDKRKSPDGSTWRNSPDNYFIII